MSLSLEQRREFVAIVGITVHALEYEYPGPRKYIKYKGNQ